MLSKIIPAIKMAGLEVKNLVSAWRMLRIRPKGCIFERGKRAFAVGNAAFLPPARLPRSKMRAHYHIFADSSILTGA